MAKTKALAYMRCSGMGQTTGDTWDRQTAAIRKYAAANGVEIVGWYSDEGVSGTKEERDGIARLMVALESNGHGAKTVIIERLDRLSRDLMVQERLISNLKAGGFELISAVEGADLLSDDPTRKFLRQVLGAVAEFDKAMTVLKLKVARERKRAKTGRCEGRRGYLDSPELLESIVSMRDVDKMTFREIAFILNHSSDSPPKLNGTEWTGDNVWKVYTKVKRREA